MVTFSVLMPAYNHEKYVAASIESVLGQTFRDLELIIIDDCSSDATPDIVRRYAASDPRVTYENGCQRPQRPAPPEGLLIKDQNQSPIRALQAGTLYFGSRPLNQG